MSEEALANLVKRYDRMEAKLEELKRFDHVRDAVELAYVLHELSEDINRMRLHMEAAGNE
ncbi:hypothetical protein [Lacticaseibacillus suilingensis]|uniref:hypothetical protein n=1 Tax=Lacticaseibacillus suilingensis TaxID=2799577 RepID=UPI0022E54232|nr:hypothetical protein [Lacticaseibacillus suilingensis]